MRTENAGVLQAGRSTGGEGKMARAGIRDVPLRAGLASAMALSLGMVLGGCAISTPDGGASRSGAGGLDLVGQPRGAIERDVEAPEVFSIEEAGLWDGRPSLGGVWVAHPGAQNPERVLIRNTQSGESVIGALFRRERENPGPQFQISSEAANALGILPGAPTAIQVTALRLEQVEVTRQPSPQPQARPEVAGAEASTGLPAGQVRIETVAGSEEAPRQGFFASLFGRRTADAAPEGEIAQTALAPVPAAMPQAAQPDDEPEQPVRTAAASAPEPRERRGLLSLFSRRSEPPQPPAETTLIPLPEVPGDPSATPQQAPQPVAPVQTALERPFVQIGIFSIEANATNARAQMQAAGLDAYIRQGRANERDFWRVVVGPAADGGARSEIVQRVRALGFGDADAGVR